MSPSFVEVVFVVALSWLVWVLLRPYVVKTSLDNIPGPPPHSFVAGDLGPLHSPHDGREFHERLGAEFGPVVALRGFFGTRVLYVTDTLALQQIIARDGALYGNSTLTRFMAGLTLGPGLITVAGAEHRRQRKMLNPTFSTDSIRSFTPIFHGIAQKLRNVIADVAKIQDGEVDMIHWLSRAGVEAIGEAGFGCSFGTINSKDAALHPIVLAVKNFFALAAKLVPFWMLASLFMTIGSPTTTLLRRLVDPLIRLLPSRVPGDMLRVVDTLDGTSRDIFNESLTNFSEQSELAEGGNLMNDSKNLLNLLLKANRVSDERSKLSTHEMISQMALLLLTGAETSSTSLGRILYLLALNQDVQHKLREEVTLIRDSPDRTVSYDDLMQLPYLDGVIRETMRLYPGFMNSRVTLQDNVLRLRTPVIGRDGAVMNEIFVPRGTVVYPAGLHSSISRDIWGDDAMEFKPERWLSPLPATVAAASIPGVYSNLMAFGGGERSCIGFRFAILEMKVILAILVESFQFYPSKRDSEVCWNWATVSYPTMGKDKMEPSLFLKVVPLSDGTSAPHHCS